MLTSLQQHNVDEQDIVVATPKKKLKILFYHAGSWVASWIYPAALQLKTYIDILYEDTAPHVQWLIPLQQEIDSKDLAKHILQNDVDVLCTSHYLWNNESLMQQIAKIKTLVPKITVIAGGPSIDVNTNKDFFQQYPYIDYAVYGAGEQAFADIINHLVLDRPMIAFNTSNCAWKHPVSGHPVVADYKFVKMLGVSPFVHNKKMFTAMVRDAKKKQLAVWLPYTLTRGCPYACTFCDWNSGLGNKVSRRKNTYKQEIDLFQQLGIKHIYLSDANVGQYDEDVDMIEYFGQKNLQENAGFTISGNYSKLRKDVNLKIFNIMAESGLVQKTLNFSIQDTNEEILKNIDRPDVGWETHATMARELVTKHPHLIVKAQLIYGLPGQTPLTWRQTLRQVVGANILPIIFLNEPLPASPARYNPEYQRRFQFEYVKSTRLDPNYVFYISEIPKKCISFDQRQLVEMTVLSGVYNALSVIKFLLLRHAGLQLDIELIIDAFLTSCQYHNLCNNLYTNWSTEQKFYFTKDFSNKPVLLASEPMGYGSALSRDINFILYITNLMPKDIAGKLSQLRLQTNLDQLSSELCSEVD